MFRGSGRNINQVSLQAPSATSTALRSYEVSVGSGPVQRVPARTQLEIQIFLLGKE